MKNRNVETSPVIVARIAGFAYLLIIILSVLSVNFIDTRLIVPGDVAATANNIMTHETLFRVGMLGVIMIYASVIVLSSALYVLLKTVDKNLALLALLFRSAEAVLGATTVLLSFIVLQLLHGAVDSTVFNAQQLQVLVGLLLNVRTAGLDIVLILVGLGGTVFCYLFFKSKFVPRILAAWGLFTYLSMLVLAIVSIVLPDHPVMIETILYALGGFFELLFGAWLLFKGVDRKQWDKYMSVSSTT